MISKSELSAIREKYNRAPGIAVHCIPLLIEEIERLREALKKYAGKGVFGYDDGTCARQALGGEDG